MWQSRMEALRWLTPEPLPAPSNIALFTNSTTELPHEATGTNIDVAGSRSSHLPANHNRHGLPQTEHGKSPAILSLAVPEVAFLKAVTA